MRLWQYIKTSTNRVHKNNYKEIFDKDCLTFHQRTYSRKKTPRMFQKQSAKHKIPE